MSDVVSLHGGPTGERKVSQSLVDMLEDALERARSGEIIGGVFCELAHDGLASSFVCGLVGGYSMIGSVEVAKGILVDIAREEM